jgi:putative resolvase
MEKVKVCYARVSSIGQKDDLVRQKELLMEKYPRYRLIEDVGSGINLTKRGLLKIIELAIGGKLEKLVIVHKDRLARFGYELIEFLIKKYSNGKEEIEPEEEMVKDVLQIMNVFVAKMNGRRKYNLKNNKKVKPKVK